MTEETITAELTAAQMRVFREVLEGLTNKEIAHKLNLSITTVKLHLMHCYRKLGIDGRRGLIRTTVRLTPKYKEGNHVA